MALVKRSMKDHSMEHSMTKAEDSDGSRRKKRSLNDDFMPDDKQYYTPQQKKRFLSQMSLSQSNRILAQRQSSDDQDDEALIRETQAALKSLSGSWPETRNSIYKPEQDENPTFPNLFEEKHGARGDDMSSMSGNGAASTSDESIDYYDEKGKRFRRDKDECMQQTPSRFRLMDSLKANSQYQSHDFNELVDDSSTELQIDIAPGKGNDEKSKEYFYGNYARVPFSQNSAFRPPADAKRSSNLGIPFYHHSDSVYAPYVSDMSAGGLCDGDEKPKDVMKIHVKDEDLSKSADSPDSKQYTILQPAGVGSKAASVMQDIAREGVVSVAAVSSTSNAGVSNHLCSSRSSFEKTMPSFSPGSSNKGNFHIGIHIDLCKFDCASRQEWSFAELAKREYSRCYDFISGSFTTTTALSVVDLVSLP